MPEVLWLLEHVRLQVDPLKDAAGSPFGKADRLYLYLHALKCHFPLATHLPRNASLF